MTELRIYFLRKWVNKPNTWPRLRGKSVGISEVISIDSIVHGEHTVLCDLTVHSE